MARKICKCVAMSALMEKLGAYHAARMHRILDHEWSTEDWLVHFEEEEKFVLPLLPGIIADDIRMEHEMMRAQIKVYGSIVNEELLEAHAEKEDEVVLKYLGYLIDDKRSVRGRNHGRYVKR